MILQMSKFSASSPTSPTVLEGKVLFCGSQMGFWSPPVHCLQKCPPIFVLQKIYISPLVHCLQKFPYSHAFCKMWQQQMTSNHNSSQITQITGPQKKIVSYKSQERRKGSRLDLIFGKTRQRGRTFLQTMDVPQQ